jgi:hypothetical protein
VIALALGTLLAIGSLAFVLWPLFDEGRVAPRPSARRAGVQDEEVGAIDALREIEFDRATGKLSDTDYTALKATYTKVALEELRARDDLAVASPATTIAGASAAPDDAEAAILRWRAQRRSCGHCGPRPEPDALYCSECGRYLEGKCGACGAAVEGPGRTFCTECGTRLAA